MNTIDEIALRVAEKLEPRGRTYSPDHYVDVVNLVLEELRKESEPAMKRYNAYMAGVVEPDPIERLRFFLAIALTGQNWLDVEQFIDALPKQVEIEQRVAENFVHKFKRHVGGDGEFWLHELECFCEEGKWREYQ